MSVGGGGGEGVVGKSFEVFEVPTSYHSGKPYAKNPVNVGQNDIN